MISWPPLRTSSTSAECIGERIPQSPACPDRYGKVDLSMWRDLQGSRSAVTPASEGGEVIRDEVHEGGARITLERGTGATPFVITCGIHDWIVHTRYFESEPMARAEFDHMKDGLAGITVKLKSLESADQDTRSSQISPLLQDFVERFP